MQDATCSAGGKILHASQFQDVSFSAGDKILSCKPLAQDVSYFAGGKIMIMQATCKMYLVLRKVLLVSCKGLAREQFT